MLKASRRETRKFSSQQRKTRPSSAHTEISLTYFSHDTLINPNTSIQVFCNNAELRKAAVCYMQETCHDSPYVCLPLFLLWHLEHFFCKSESISRQCCTSNSNFGEEGREYAPHVPNSYRPQTQSAGAGRGCAQHAACVGCSALTWSLWQLSTAAKGDMRNGTLAIANKSGGGNPWSSVVRRAGAGKS